jgi:hypothetical protein
MPFYLRGRKRLGPLVFNYSQRGLTSWGIKIGPFTHNFTRRRTSVDLPGPVNWRSRGRGRSR